MYTLNQQALAGAGAFSFRRVPNHAPRGNHMLSIQRLAEIAARHPTAMADAMVAACIARHLRTGEPLSMPERKAFPRPAPCLPVGDSDRVDWVRMVEGNADTREMHC